MRPAALLLALATATFFAVSFALTFTARSHVVRYARDYVLVRTQRYATPAVDAAERLTRSPAARRLLREDDADRIDQEIADYRRDPRAYVSDLVATSLAAASGRADPATAPATTRRARIHRAVTKLRQDVRDYFARTFTRLLLDLRIFTGTNAVAALIAAAIAWRPPPPNASTPPDADGRPHYLALVAALLLASVALQSWQYVNHLSYFSILLNSFVGWWYPVLVIATFLRLW
jgi:hypothetical protein